jgi:hypothetical protein
MRRKTFAWLAGLLFFRCLCPGLKEIMRLLHIPQWVLLIPLPNFYNQLRQLIVGLQ